MAASYFLLSLAGQPVRRLAGRAGRRREGLQVDPGVAPNPGPNRALKCLRQWIEGMALLAKSKFLVSLRFMTAVLVTGLLAGVAASLLDELLHGVQWVA